MRGELYLEKGRWEGKDIYGVFFFGGISVNRWREDYIEFLGIVLHVCVVCVTGYYGFVCPGPMMLNPSRSEQTIICLEPLFIM